MYTNNMIIFAGDFILVSHSLDYLQKLLQLLVGTVPYEKKNTYRPSILAGTDRHSVGLIKKCQLVHLFSPQNSLQNMPLFSVPHCLCPSLFSTSVAVENFMQVRFILGCCCPNLSTLPLPTIYPCKNWLDMAIRTSQKCKDNAPGRQSSNNGQQRLWVKNFSFSFVKWTILKGVVTFQVSRGNLESKPTTVTVIIYASQGFFSLLLSHVLFSHNCT